MMRRLAFILALLAGALGCRRCAPTPDPVPDGKNRYEGAGPARLRVPQVRLSGAVSEPARVTVGGAADLDGADDAAWSAAVKAGAGGLPEGFGASEGEATIDLEVRAEDTAGLETRRRVRVRVTVE